MIRPTLMFLLASATFAQQRPPQPPPIQPKAQELAAIKAKTDEIGAVVRSAKAKHVAQDLVADVEVYEKAGRMLLEFPDEFFTQDGINHALTVLDTGRQRAAQLTKGESPWISGRKRMHGFYSDVDGSVEPYGVTVPEGYDGKTPLRLYVWMHGRAQRLTEADFLYSIPNAGPGRPPVADVGQIAVDVYGRWNGGGWHWSGETEVFEAIAAVKKRYKIDDKRILLRGFSMGGEGAWHIALHHPDRFAAAEIGAGTWSRRATLPGLEPYQLAALRIWENMHEWALNAFNLPIGGHDGDTDTQTAVLPGYAPGTPNRGQLESSLKVRDQLAKEGFPLEGAPDFLSAKGSGSIFLISEKTGHGTSPLVRERLDGFLKKWGDKGQVSPDHVRFVTYTTRYNQDYWVSLAQMEKLYERAEVDAERSTDGKTVTVKSTNVQRLELREMERTQQLKIDGQTLPVKAASQLVLEKANGQWHVAGPPKGLHKVHALQGPIDDAFLDPFILVRPTGTPWNKAVNDQALRTLARFDRLYARFLRAHPRVIDDKDLKPADFAKYNVVLFGDPGSNRWIAKLNGKLPAKWTRQKVTLGGKSFTANEHYPVMAYPNPLSGNQRYVVINTGLTIEDREYRGDYGMPRLGDYAVMKVKEGADVGDVAIAGLFNSVWK